MFERILMAVDSVSESLGLLRSEAKARPGVNPWGYKGGDGHEMVDNPHGQATADSEERGTSYGLPGSNAFGTEEKVGMSRW